MFRVLFAPILRSTNAAYSHRCVYLWKAEVIIVSRGVELYFAKYNSTPLNTIITSAFHRYTHLWMYAAVVLLRMGANSTRNMQS
jgi:hypothetical protein